MSDDPNQDDQGGQASDGSSSDQGAHDGQSTDDGQGSGSEKDKNWLEWTITGLGAALVLFVFGFLIYGWVTSTDNPAELEVTLGQVTLDGAIAEIPVTVKNTGGKVAEAAVIEVCAGPEACAQLTFDYIPFASRADGRVGLAAPLASPPSSRVVSFRNP